MKTLRINKLPHLLYLPSLLVVLLFLILPLELQAWPANFFRGSRIGYTRKINPQKCVSKNNEVGICMFAWDCMKSNGIHLGTCMDRYLVGSCCASRSESPSMAMPMHPVDNMIRDPDVNKVPPSLDASDKPTDVPGSKPEDFSILTEGILQSGNYSSTQTTPDSRPPSTIDSNALLDSTDSQTLTESDDAVIQEKPEDSGISETILGTSSESSDFDSTSHVDAPVIISHDGSSQNESGVEIPVEPSGSVISINSEDFQEPVSEIVDEVDTKPLVIESIPIDSSGILPDGTDDGSFGLEPVPEKPVSEADEQQDDQQSSNVSDIEQQSTQQSEPPSELPVHNEIVLPEQKPIKDDVIPLPPSDDSMLEKPETEKPAPDVSISENEIVIQDESTAVGDDATTITPPMKEVLHSIEGGSQTDSSIFTEQPDMEDSGVPSDVLPEVPEDEFVGTSSAKPGSGVPATEDVKHEPSEEEIQLATTQKPQLEDDGSNILDIASFLEESVHGPSSDKTEGESSVAEDAGHPSKKPDIPEAETEAEATTMSPIDAPWMDVTEISKVEEDADEVSETTSIPSSTTIPNSWDEIEIVISAANITTSLTAASTTTTTTTTTMSTPTEMTPEGYPIHFPQGDSDDLTTTPEPLTAAEQEDKLLERLQTSTYKEVCGDPVYPSSRIVGGYEATYGEWPWQVSLRQWRSMAFLHKCGAALVNENWAITAAHCVEGIEPDQLLLVMGEYDLGRTTEPYGHIERTVQVTAMHPKFEPRTFEYDLALLRFSEPVIFQPNIIPICIPHDDYDFLNETGYVTGWGRLYEDGPLPTVMQKVPVPVIPNEECEDMYKDAGYIEHIPNIFICAGYQNGKQDSCEGDSGGPMVILYKNRWRLAGIISWGIGCAVANQPGVYTRISEFRDWINKIIMF